MLNILVLSHVKMRLIFRSIIYENLFSWVYEMCKRVDLVWLKPVLLDYKPYYDLDGIILLEIDISYVFSVSEVHL